MTAEPVRWGVLSTAYIATDRVIPAMRDSAHGRIEAIASRDPAKARAVADRLDIPKAYGGYQALLDDPDIEVVYNALPNHLHLEWSARALEAGKHVLCEKPVAMNAAEARELLSVRDRTGYHIEEAFMVRGHPQWAAVRELIAAGEIGALRSVQLSYFNTADDPADIRNQRETGGGSIYDIGCYTVAIARLIFDDEPRRAVALMERDPNFGTDRLSTAILEFPNGQASLSVGTQSTFYQHAQIIGSRGWIRADFPYAHPEPTACHLFVGDAASRGCFHARSVDFDPVDQYRLQSDRFSQLVRGADVPTWPLETAVANMVVLDAIYRSGESGQWERV